MKTWPIIALLVGASVAHGQPKPVKPAVCMPSYFESGRVVVSKGIPLACWVKDSSKCP